MDPPIHIFLSCLILKMMEQRPGLTRQQPWNLTSRQLLASSYCRTLERHRKKQTKQMKSPSGGSWKAECSASKCISLTPWVTHQMVCGSFLSCYVSRAKTWRARCSRLHQFYQAYCSLTTASAALFNYYTENIMGLCENYRLCNQPQDANI